MAVPPFNLLDTKIGDRKLGPAEVVDLLEQSGEAPLAAFAAPPPIGDDTPNTGEFTDLTADTLTTTGTADIGGDATLAGNVEVGSGTRTAAATAGAATLAKPAGKITSEALTTAAGASYTLTLTNSEIDAADIVLASVQLGTATEGTPQIVTVTVTANTAVIVVKNIHATEAFDGTIVISFLVIKQ